MIRYNKLSQKNLEDPDYNYSYEMDVGKCIDRWSLKKSTLSRRLTSSSHAKPWRSNAETSRQLRTRDAAVLTNPKKLKNYRDWGKEAPCSFWLHCWAAAGHGSIRKKGRRCQLETAKENENNFWECQARERFQKAAGFLELDNALARVCTLLWNVLQDSDFDHSLGEGECQQ